MKLLLSKKNIMIGIVMLSFLFSLEHSRVYAQADEIIIDNQTAKEDITDHVEVFIDKNHRSLSEISNIIQEFQPLKEASIDGEMADSTYWISLNLHNTTEAVKDIIIEVKKPHLSLISLYKWNENEPTLLETMGYSLPFNNREIKNRNMIFSTTLPSTETPSIYLLKIETDSFFQAPITIWEPTAFIEHSSNAEIGFGLYYGIMIAMILYNTFLFISLKEKTYFYYILFILGFTIMQAIWDGLAFQWIWGNYPWWALRSNSFTIIWTSLFALQFAKHFLQLKTEAPLLHKIVHIFSYLCFLSLLIPLLIPIPIATMTSTIIASVFVLLIICMISTVRIKTREAKFFLAAWGFLLIGVILNLLAAYRIIPLTAISLYAPKIGAVIEVLVLSLGLADRIKRVTLEKERESKKHYLQTLLQSSLKQMSTLKEVDYLAYMTILTLINLTKHEKGIYFLQENATWTILAKTEEIDVTSVVNIDPKYLDEIIYSNEVLGKKLGLNEQIGSVITIPISLKNHIGLIILFSNEKHTLENYVKSKIIPTFVEQYNILLSNLLQYHTLRKSAMFDHLTGVYNREHFFNQAISLIEKSKKLNQEVALLLIDIDHFKNINDTYGHQIGDQAITFVTNQITKTVGKLGIIGRYGGEEFIVLLENASSTNALDISTILLHSLRNKPFHTSNGDTIYITVSIGSYYRDNINNLSLDDMIQKADEFLYVAKNNGRDQVASPSLLNRR